MPHWAVVVASMEAKLSFVEPGRRWAHSPSPSKAPGIPYQGTMKKPPGEMKHRGASNLRSLGLQGATLTTEPPSHSLLFRCLLGEHVCVFHGVCTTDGPPWAVQCVWFHWHSAYADTTRYYLSVYLFTIQWGLLISYTGSCCLSQFVCWLFCGILALFRKLLIHFNK